jgi:hypothetical protein
MLERFFIPQLDVKNVIGNKMGTSPQSQDVTQYLNQTFPLRWVGPGDYIPWPPRSPDLTPMGF